MPVYLISKAVDPLFAAAIGSSAALIRIKREEKEKHPEAEVGLGTVFGTGSERLKRWWAGEFDGAAKTSAVAK
ncbi:uncharacterized protein DSM5745_08914 [Aspergillus mulundensis]|uniref:Non-classical export protein 1 n=1 Tax=Aspergillus mulundensis TaxID=1810919 RepID=A0A3D8R5R7_9EURO|nr:Uncharacterized protein DSM5745_08914 [Aspergillus mulundensis]RDW69154.1 Uncharacterized protein DSM5745_08914 [Aspergillus mulundensis]